MENLYHAKTSRFQESDGQTDVYQEFAGFCIPWDWHTSSYSAKTVWPKMHNTAGNLAQSLFFNVKHSSSKAPH